MDRYERRTAIEEFDNWIRYVDERLQDAEGASGKDRAELILSAKLYAEEALEMAQQGLGKARVEKARAAIRKVERWKTQRGLAGIVSKSNIFQR